MKARSIFAAAGLVALVALTISAAEIKLEGVKCLLNPKADVKESTAVDYKEGKVYFCCNNCAGKFKSDPAAMASKANHQLVATGQYAQTACPFSGGELNPEQAVTIGGVKVEFCCGNCKKKAEGKEGDEQVDLVFGDAAFGKGFAVPKSEGE